MFSRIFGAVGPWSIPRRFVKTYAKCISEFEEVLYKNAFNTAEVFKIRDLLSADVNTATSPSAERWKTNAEILLSYLDVRGLKKVLQLAPNVLNMVPSKLQHNVEALRSSQGEQLQWIAVDCPVVLTRDADLTLGRLQALQEIFPRKKLFKLISKNLSLLTEPMEEIRERFRYLTVFMGQDQRDMIRSSALDFDVNHMRVRHLAAEWTGVFKPVKMKTRMNQNMRAKPDLVDLLSTSDEDFCRRVIGIGLDEYSAFVEMMDAGLIDPPDAEVNVVDSEDEQG